MSGSWQQYPPQSGGYQQPHSYNQQIGYQHGNYPQPNAYGYAPQTMVYGQFVSNPPQMHPQPVVPYSQANFTVPYVQHGPHPPHASQLLQGQPTPQVQHSQNNCFNCGSPAHWAQNCPEPRRQVPFGQLAQQHRPKRFRPNFKPPVITKYPVPVHVAQAQQTPSFATNTNWNAAAQAYPTPSSTASSPTRPSWPNPQQIYSQSQHAIPSASEMKPATGSLGQHHTTSQCQEILTPPNGADPQASLIRRSLSCGSQTHVPVEIGSPPVSGRSSRRQSVASIDQSVSMESESDDEECGEDLLKLDIPDLPDLNCYEGAKQPHLVTTPLPASWECDKLDEVTSPSSQPQETRSRYQGIYFKKSFARNVRESDEFTTLRDDPIFLHIVPDIPLRVSTPTPVPLNTTQRQSDDTDLHAMVPSVQLEPSNRKSSSPDRPTGNPVYLARKHYSDATPKKPFSDGIPPPPPPPPPADMYSKRTYHGEANGSPGKQRRYSAKSPELPPRRVSTGDATSCSPQSLRKRKRHDDDGQHRAGERQRDSSANKSRRNAPKVAAVYSRRW